MCKRQKTDSQDKWTPRKERLMCQLWEQHPSLFDPKKRKPEEKDEIISKISLEIGMDGL